MMQEPRRYEWHRLEAILNLEGMVITSHYNDNFEMHGEKNEPNQHRTIHNVK